MYISPFGKAEGLPERLERFASELSKDRRFPWMGTGLIDDLHAAAALIAGRPLPMTMDEEIEAEELVRFDVVQGTVQRPDPLLGPCKLEYDL